VLEIFTTTTTAKLFVDEISVQLLYRNALDIHCKHTASHLHDVEVNVASVHHV